MKRFYDFLIIAVTNLIGFLSVSICFYTLLSLGIINENYFVNDSQITFQSWAAGILVVWLICLGFSIAALFIQQKQRLVLMIAPAVIPGLYGFSVLVLFGGI
ncbi:MAG: hypothetical protein ACLFR0_01835 [Alphaproteobacteria bacterium]